MPEINSNQISASNILVESIKLVFTISTVYIGAFFTYAQSDNRDWSFWLAIVFLTATSILSIWSINAIVNKIWDGCDRNIMADSVRYSFMAAAFLLFSGIGISLYHIRSVKTSTKSELHQLAPSSIRINDGEVIVTDSLKTKIKIERMNGKITTILINQ